MSVGGNGTCDGSSDQTGCLAPFGLRLSIDFGDALSGKARIYRRGNFFIREVRRPPRSVNDPLSAWDQRSELDLRPAAKTLLPCAILHSQWETERVQTRVHRFVENSRCDLGIREIRVHRKRQLHQTCTLFVEVGSPAREALYDDVCEISLEMPEVVGCVALDEG